jgi:pyruvate formate lyase activating enzyme
MEGGRLKPAQLYESLNSRLRCTLCERRCEIPENKRGFCGVRVNLSGKLYTLTYGNISAVEPRPIEIKPFYHFYPASEAITFSTWGCNFSCMWCQNWHLSQSRPPEGEGNYIPPKEMLRMALTSRVQGTCASFNEPTLLFEYCLDLFPIAKEKGLYNTFVSNGYMSVNALRRLTEVGLDAINIDMKGNNEVYRRYCSGAEASVVWRNIKLAKKLGLHVEVVNLVVTGVNDSEEDVGYVIENHLRYAGEETPLHFTRYHPAYKFEAPPTSIATLEMAYEKAKHAGVLYPYLGNVPDHRYENTYCHACGKLLIRRRSYRVLGYSITKEKRCPQCGAEIPIVGEYCGQKK